MADHDPSQLPIGTILEGKFRISREIGRGGMAAVYEAENIDIGKRVAVKILSADLITSRVVRERFLREARAAAAIHSPHICDVYDSGTYQERPFLVMELLRGESLYELQARERRLDVDTTLRVALQTARGLAKAHAAGVVHRDLKPENIFLTRNEDGQLVAKILDFGLAKFYETTTASPTQARLTREGALFGTPAYMAPEQAQGLGNVDHRCDLWALGCIVYECLTASTVWRVDQGVAMILAQIATSALPVPSQMRGDLPESFDRWFAKALARDPAERFQSAKEFASALSRALPAQRPLAPDPDSTSDDSPVGGPWFGATADFAALGGLGSSPQSPLASPTAPRATAAMPLAGATGQSPRFARARFAATVTLLILGLALAGVVVWRIAAGELSGDAIDGVGSLFASRRARPPLEKEPWALQIGSAQEWLAKGDAKHAVTMFREALEGHGSGLTLNLVAHAEAILENKGRPCTVTGLGRPRPFSVDTPSTRPTVLVTKVGAVVAWADTHQDARRRQAYSVVLDAELRRVSAPHLITPEFAGVMHPQLFAAGKRVGLVFTDTGTTTAGVYVRLLEADGRIAGPPIRVSADVGGQYSPAAIQIADGVYWVLWEGRISSKRDDLVARRLDENLEPVSPPLPWTAFSPETGNVSRPHAAMFGSNRLIAVFSLRLQRSGRIVALDVPYQGRGPGAGVAAPPGGGARDVYLGEQIPISTDFGLFDQARVACDATGCFIAWDNERGGATVSFVDMAAKRVTWRQELGKKGSRPALASAGGQIMLAWYDSSRVQLARITREGVSPPTAVGKVSGFQPYPSVTPGAAEGEWYVSWRDYESGHLEAFVARARCSDASQGT